MAVMAAEAVPELVTGSEAASAAAARSAAGGRAATAAGGGKTGGYFGTVTAPPAASQSASQTRPASRSGAKGSGRHGGRARGADQQAADVVAQHHRARRSQAGWLAGSSDLGTGWHRVVMAEFLAAIAILVLAPILTPDGETGTSKGFFKAADIVRMTAVCLVYFILALLSNGRKIGKVAAAFGGLVLTGIIINNATGTQSIFKGLAAIFTSAFGTSTTATEVSDPNLVYGQVGANIFSQLLTGGTPTPGTSATTAPLTATEAALAAGSTGQAIGPGTGTAAGAGQWTVTDLTGGG